MKNLLKTLAITAVIATTTTAQTSAVWNGTADTSWYNSIATEFVLTTAEELAGLAQLANSGTSRFSAATGRAVTIKLGANIMLNDTTNWRDWSHTNAPRNAWVPIGTANSGFAGLSFTSNFDGNGYVISGVYINSSGLRQGFFGNVAGYKINNLGIVGAFVSAGSEFGVLAGSTGGDAIIDNCYAIAIIKARGDWLESIGGLVGRNNFGAISNSYFDGIVSDGGFSNVRNLGGLVGHNTGNITNSYSTAVVSGDWRNAGGLVGARVVGTITNSFYDSEKNGYRFHISEMSKTTAQMRQRGTFVGWDFENIWYIEEGVSYPYFQNRNQGIILPEYTFVYTGDPIRISSPIRYFDRGNEFLLTENTDFRTSYTNNTNAGVATVVITGIGRYSFEITKHFRINKRDINVIWGDSTLQWHGAVQAPTATSIDNERFPLIVSGNGREIGGNYIATATLLNSDDNIVLHNTQKQYSIIRRTIDVEWEEIKEPFIFNKMVQYPRAITHSITRQDGSVLEIPFAEMGRQSAAGRHLLQAVPRVDDNIRTNLSLTINQFKEYDILQRPLNVVMRDRNNNVADTVVADTTIRVSGNLFDYIESILDFDNFATDTIRNETDDRSVLQGRPRIAIQNLNNNSRTLRNDGLILDRNIVLPIGERFLVTVITDSITADNYTILERNIAITISERFITLSTDPRENVSISNTKKSDNRYGIKFAVNPVSDKAEINVVLPNNEKATETKIVIYDMTGNVVFERRGNPRGYPTVWDLRNSAGRLVANGTYLVIAEVKGASGRIYAYSAKLGVRR